MQTLTTALRGGWTISVENMINLVTMKETYNVCAVLWMVLVTVAVPSSGSDNFCATYASLDVRLEKCRSEKTFKIQSDTTGLSFGEARSAYFCSQLPLVAFCSEKAVESCPETVQSLVTEHMDAVREGICSPYGWFYNYTVPVFEKVFQESCFMELNLSLCLDIAKDFDISTSLTVAEGVASFRYTIGRMFECAKHVISRQVPGFPECTMSWPEVVYAFLMVFVTQQMPLGVRLYPEQIEQLQDLGESRVHTLFELLSQ